LWEAEVLAWRWEPEGAAGAGRVGLCENQKRNVNVKREERKDEEKKIHCVIGNDFESLDVL